MPSRGVLYIVWGADLEPVLARSIASLKEHHPELPHHVVRLPEKNDRLQNLLEKSRMMSLSPFDETLFLDADTVVLGNLDFAFEQAARYGLACCICEAPWARRYPALPQNDAVEYNTGVLFFSRKAEALFRRWEELTPQIDSSLPNIDDLGLAVQLWNDQCVFAKIVAEWDRLPFVLPLNYNFRPAFQWTFFGPLKVWHDYRAVPPSIMEINRNYTKPGAIIQFHQPPPRPPTP